jgi:hypothetical protein
MDTTRPAIGTAEYERCYRDLVARRQQLEIALAPDDAEIGEIIADFKVVQLHLKNLEDDGRLIPSEARAEIRRAVEVQISKSSMLVVS